jgi:glutamyl-tRNA synthetase
MSDDVENHIRELALKNAVSHGGTAEKKAVISKLLGSRPDLRARAREVIPDVERIVGEVNALDEADQRDELTSIDPAFFEVEKREKRSLPPLPHAREGEVVTRLPPEPNGYPHIGHGLSFFFNHYYARLYDGKVILRFDDTNPRKEKAEFYDAIRSDLTWLGLDWEREHNMSDDMKIYYQYATRLVRQGDAYVCDCDQERVSALRYKGEPCPCSRHGVDENESLWNGMFDRGEGEAVLRLRGDIASQNTAMRDPTLFRVIDHPHPIHGDLYSVWPVYDFACAIEDSVLGITHVLRSNEFALRIELQDYIRERLGLRSPVTLQYSRFTIRGSPTSKRLIRPLIDEGVVSGYDDPRLVTLRALHRRGIVPETVGELAKEMGLSTSEPEIDWSLVESINRKLIDPRARRYFFAADPVGIEVEGLSTDEVSLPLHPTVDLGTRTIPVDGTLFVSREDADAMSTGDRVRLKDLCNIEVVESGDTLRATVIDDEVDLRSIQKIQWVPGSGVATEMIVPSPLYVDKELQRDSITLVQGIAEPAFRSCEVDDIVQFERVGFVRVDRIDSPMRTIFAHR